tara:strand:+ start:100 stop:681 length:582 start_codon:yes stop_codon:yes gene_type:complete
MKYPLTKAEEKLKAKLEKKKKDKIHRHRRIYSERVIRYRRIDPPHDYLKYWRVIHYWALNKYNIKSPDLDILFFLYGEGYFNKTDYLSFNQLLRWDKLRFKRLLDDGWIHVWRRDVGLNKNTKLYELTPRGKMMVADIYKKLNGEEIKERNANMFGASPSYSEKVYRNYIHKLNQETLQERRLARQSRGTSRR